MSTTLLLNASYEPLRVIPLRRALHLVLAKKAEVLEEGEGVVRSAKVTMPRPSVIRLTYMVKVPYRSRLPLTRTNLTARDRGECQYCGASVGSRGTIDHVVPRSRGGKHAWENVVLACGPCNSKKDDRTLSELGWSLERKPFAPKGTSWIIIGLHRVEDSWQPYLPALA